jgi:DNA-binding MarR family transcriptional regulator
MPVQHYRPETYRSRDSVGYLVRRLFTVWMERFERALAQADLTLTQWVVLIQLRDGVVSTASDIAHDLRYDSGALTRLLDQLERRGFVRRRRSVQDRRLVELELTAAGRRTVEALLPVVVEQTNAALAPLDRREFVQFRDFLVRILEHSEPAQGELPPRPVRAPRTRTARGRSAAGTRRR